MIMMVAVRAVIMRPFLMRIVIMTMMVVIVIAIGMVMGMIMRVSHGAA